MSKSKKSLKHKNIKMHFKSRCLERLGYCINSKELVKKIHNFTQNNKDIRFYKKQSLTRTVWVYYNQLDKRYYRIVYDKNRKDIVTIFPHNDRKKGIHNGIQNGIVQDC